MDALGLAATHGQRVVVRQTLAGSNYGLVDDDTEAPNPDFWASLLWKRCMGGTVFGVRRVGEDPFVRTYAHSTPARDGGVSLLVVNLHPARAARVRIEDPAADRAELYVAT